MSDRDEPREKITVLFPKGGADESESSEEDEPSQPKEAAGEREVEESVGEDEKVVHLDFQRNTTRRSPRPDSDPDQEVAPEDKGKFKVFSEIIEEGMVMVTLDTRLPEVYIPPKFRGLPELRLNFSHQFQLTDFEYDDQGVRASLSFQGTRHFVDLPWAAVFMLYSHETGEVYIFEPGGES